MISIQNHGLKYVSSVGPDLGGGDPELNCGTPSLRSGFGTAAGNTSRPLGRGEAVLCFLVLLRRLSSEDSIRIAIRDTHFDTGERAMVHSLRLEVAPGARSCDLLFDVENDLARLAARSVAPGEGQPVPAFGIGLGRGEIDPACQLFLELEGSRLLLHHRLDRFSEADARRLLSIFEAIASAPGFAGETTVGELRLLGERDLEIVARVNEEARRPRPFESLPAAFARQVALSPSRIAVWEGERFLTYEQLDRRSSRLAHALRGHGVGTDSIVAVYADRTIETVVALFAIQKTGAAHVPLSPGYPPARSAHVLTDSGVRLLVTDRDASGLPFDGIIVSCDEACPDRDGEPIDPPDVDVRPNHLAYILHTSGSTGLPKGAQIEHGQLTNFFQGMDDIIVRGAPGEEVWLSVTGISFDISILELFWTLCRGMTVVLSQSLDPTQGGHSSSSSFEKLLRFRRVTHLQCTPSVASVLLEDRSIRDALGTMVQWLVGGEALSELLASRMLGTGVPVVNMYGPTETTVWSTSWNVEPGPVLVGKPLANQEVHVLDENRQPVPVGIPGELWIGGAGVGRGYLRRPELTAERFVELQPGRRAYRTGDLVRLREDGELEFLGRADHQVKIRGHRIEPGEIEAAIAKCSGIRRVVVMARSIASEPRIVAYVEGAPGDAAAIRERATLACVESLPSYMVPSHVEVLESFPQTPNGKVDRNRLPEPSRESMIGSQRLDTKRNEGAEPKNPIEKAVAKEFEELLGYGPASLADDFFALGGHSLQAVRLLGRLERAFGVTLPVSTMLETSTIGGLSILLRELLEHEAVDGPGVSSKLPVGKASRSLVLLRAGEGRPLFLVHGAGGNLLSFVGLTHHMQSPRPLYGLQARGVDGTLGLHASIDEMARDYLEEVKSVQMNGPFLLGGFSGGGVVALEMARQLQANGDEVAALLLLDSFIPGLRARRPKLRERWDAIAKGGVAALKAQLRHGMQRRLEQRRTTSAIRNALRKGGPMPLDLRDPWLTRSFDNAAADYPLRPWDGPAVLFRAEETDPYFGYVGFELGWKGLLERLRVVVVPGTHDTLLMEPNVRTLAVKLDTLLSGLD